ncbi:two-component sensor histidine kinase, partial [bacterium]|nr:two-component sensor histidine kinase [bacterium]
MSTDEVIVAGDGQMGLVMAAAAIEAGAPPGPGLGPVRGLGGGPAEDPGKSPASRLADPGCRR